MLDPDDDYFEIRGRSFPKWTSTVNGEGDEILTETKEWTDYKDHLRTVIACEAAGLVTTDFNSFDKYVGQDLPRNIPKLKKFVEQFDKTFKSVNLYLWSSRNGTQKSTTAKTLCYELVKRKKLVQFVLMGNLLKSLTNENFADAEHETVSLIDRCRSADFLVIDDSFDPNKVTMYKSGYQLSFLDMFLRQRIEEDRRSTCFTSNIPPDGIDAKVFGVSLKALVVRSIPVPMEFNDGIDDFNPANLWDGE
jgi:DNA replication protein DnaC